MNVICDILTVMNHYTVAFLVCAVAIGPQLPLPVSVVDRCQECFSCLFRHYVFLHNSPLALAASFI